MSLLFISTPGSFLYFCQKYFSIFPYPLLTSLSSTRSLISPLDCLFVLLFPYSLDYVSGRPYLSAIIHAGHISYIFENTHTPTHPPPPPPPRFFSGTQTLSASSMSETRSQFFLTQEGLSYMTQHTNSHESVPLSTLFTLSERRL